jgi:hypothetical protein
MLGEELVPQPIGEILPMIVGRLKKLIEDAG